MGLRLSPGWALAQRRASWIVLVLGVMAVVLVPAWPGRANFDTDTMLVHMRRGPISDAYMPVLEWLARPLLRLGVRLPAVFVVQVPVIVLGVGALLRSTGASRRVAQVAAAGVCLTPLMVGALIALTRDTWYFAGLLACLTIAVHPTLQRRRRWQLLTIGCVLTLLVRQNAVFAIGMLLALSLWHEFHELRPARRAALTVSLACAGPLLVFALSAGFERLTHIRQDGPGTVAMMTDLDELSSRTGELLLPEDIANEPIDVDYLSTTNPFRLHQLFYLDNAVDLRQPPEGQRLVRDSWRSAVRHHFGEWVATRNRLFARQMGWSGPTYEIYIPVDDTSYALPRARFPDASEGVTTYLSWFTTDRQWWVGGWIHRPWIWLVIGWTAAALRRQRLVVTVVAVATAHAAGLWLVAPSVQYRLAEATVLLCLVGAVAAIIHPTTAVTSVE